MDNVKHFKMRLVVVAIVALVVATGAIATGPTVPDYHFPVGVTNTTTTPEVPVSTAHPFTPAGELQVECGMETWRTLAKGLHNQYFDCYPSTASGPFDLNYKARLADDADGNPVYHTGTVTISCTRGSDDPAVPNHDTASIDITGSGTGITASNLVCEFPPGSSGD